MKMLLLFLLSALPLVRGQFDLNQLLAACASTSLEDDIGLYGRYYAVINGQLKPTVCNTREGPDYVLSGFVYCHTITVFIAQFKIPKGVVLFFEDYCEGLESREDQPKACDVPGTSEIIRGKKAVAFIEVPTSILLGREDNNDCFDIGCDPDNPANMYYRPNQVCEECPTKKPTTTAAPTEPDDVCDGAEKKRDCEKCVDALDKRKDACDELKAKNNKDCNKLLKQCKKQPIKNPTNKKCKEIKSSNKKKQCQACVKAMGLNKKACNMLKTKENKNCGKNLNNCKTMLENLENMETRRLF